MSWIIFRTTRLISHWEVSPEVYPPNYLRWPLKNESLPSFGQPLSKKRQASGGVFWACPLPWSRSLQMCCFRCFVRLCVSFSSPFLDLCHVSRNVRPLLFLFSTAKIHIDRPTLWIQCYWTNRNHLPKKFRQGLNVRQSEHCTCPSDENYSRFWASNKPFSNKNWTLSPIPWSWMCHFHLPFLTYAMSSAVFDVFLFKYRKTSSISNISNTCHWTNRNQFRDPKKNPQDLRPLARVPLVVSLGQCGGWVQVSCWRAGTT